MADMVLGFSLGGISLGSSENYLVTEQDMRKAVGSELHLLQQTGVLTGADEAIYLKEPVELIGPEWDPMVIVKNGKVKMISIQRIMKDEQTKDRVWDDALILYTHELGGPAGRTDDRLIWELPQRRKVVIEKRELFGGGAGRAVTIILSCKDPEDLPKQN
jgi:hypothetical protein